jgi:uncharacterized membrane protein YdjX (TVP38/TMEM64 family)
MREVFESTIGCAGAVVGVLIIGSCTIAGGSIEGFLGALMGLIGGTLIAMFLVGWVYAYFLLRRDQKEILTLMEKLKNRGGKH